MLPREGVDTAGRCLREFLFEYSSVSEAVAFLYHAVGHLEGYADDNGS